MKHVFIIGSKGIPAKYGGFETFVEKLTEGKKNKEIKYHVSCLGKNSKEFEHNGARCFTVNVPNIGPAKAVYYDIMSLKTCINYIKNKNIENAIVYILACRIGPFMKWKKKQVSKLNAKLFVNPDGHEWKRGKWSKPIKKYWKISEKLMVKYADLLICDSINIQKYIQQEYKRYCPKTTYIAYGADIEKSKLKDNDSKLINWYKEKEIKEKNYYLVVGRFVPENNYEIMISEFMKCNTKKDLVLITNVEKNKFYQQLKVKTSFEQDDRIKFVGTVYDQDLLKKIREGAYGYIHGHEVGGTNPSLLEALSGTKLNLLLDVGFNKEVAENGAFYWDKKDKKLTCLIEKVDAFSQEKINTVATLAKNRIFNCYSWSYIINKYESTFLNKDMICSSIDAIKDDCNENINGK